MLFQLFQLVVNDPQRFQSSIRLGFGRGGKIGRDFLPGIGYGLLQQSDIVFGILDAVKWTLGLTTHDEILPARE